MEPDPKPDERRFWEEFWREQQEDARKRLEYSVGYAVAALKSLLFLNGGSVISLLTFIGNSHSRFNGLGIFWALVWFVCGIFSVLLSYFGAYFSQSYFMNSSNAGAKNALGKALNLPVSMDDTKPAATGNRWIGFAVITAVASFLFFGLGAFVALFAIT